MRERWSTGRVAQLAPDPASVRAALHLATPVRWESYGSDERLVWGLCAGSGKNPYRTTVDLGSDTDGPAYSCSCPSRKFPCKHALALLLLWSQRLVPGDGTPPAFAAEWATARATAAARAEPVPKERDEEAAAKRAAERARRVADGLTEVDRWLCDRVRTGLAHAGGASVERVAARMVDAQAPGVAGMVRRTAATPASGAGWPGRLLAQYAQLHLLVRAYEQVDALPPDLAAVVRARVGFTVSRDEVLAGPAVRDRWSVLGVRESAEGRVDTRRVWLRGARTRRWALLLLFAAGGAELSAHADAGLLPGVTIDADLHFHRGAPALRALIGERHGGSPATAAPAPEPVDTMLSAFADGLAQDPWLNEWPVVLSGIPEEEGGAWRLHCAQHVLPLALGGADIWPLLATSGGAAVPVTGEWTGAALRPLTCWHGDTAVRL